MMGSNTSLFYSKVLVLGNEDFLKWGGVGAEKPIERLSNHHVMEKAE